MECGRGNTQTAFFVTQVSELMQKPGQLVGPRTDISVGRASDYRARGRRIKSCHVPTLTSISNTGQSSTFVITSEIDNKIVTLRSIRMVGEREKKSKTGH